MTPALSDCIGEIPGECEGADSHLVHCQPVQLVQRLIEWCKHVFIEGLLGHP